MLKETPVIFMKNQFLTDYQVWAVECDICKHIIRIPVYSWDIQQNEEYIIHCIFTRGWFIGFKTICPSCITAIKH